jgi:hypothetical protein
MDVITVNNEEVIECPHCAGKGICKHSQVQRIEGGGDKKWGWQHICDTCGSGVFQPDSFFLTTKSLNPPKPPTCKVCSGRGITRV